MIRRLLSLVSGPILGENGLEQEILRRGSLLRDEEDQRLYANGIDASRKRVIDVAAITIGSENGTQWFEGEYQACDWSMSSSRES